MLPYKYQIYVDIAMAIARVRFENPNDSAQFFVLNKFVCSHSQLQQYIDAAVLRLPPTYTCISEPKIFGSALLP
ncbi:hypothetical protein [Nostoc sp.]